MKKKLILFLSVAFISILPIKSWATIWICFGSGECFYGEGTCDGWCPDAPASPTCSNCAIAFNPNIDWITLENGHGWIIHDGIKTAIISDMMAAFLAEIKRKNPNISLKDIKTNQRISKEILAFKKTDDGIIGDARLKLIMKETGLKISKGKSTKAEKKF